MDEEQPLGWVPVEGRGSLPFALVHGESLVAAASWAVGEAGIYLFDASVGFDQLRESGRILLVHDPLCPLTPPDFLDRAVSECRRTGEVVVGYRPVTDTLKRVHDGVLAETVDRESVREVASPVVIPAAVLARMDELDATDLHELVARLAGLATLHWLEAPAIARRVVRAEDLVGLEALSRAQS